eukprot:3066742-Amphidinium_carterae.1
MLEIIGRGHENRPRNQELQPGRLDIYCHLFSRAPSLDSTGRGAEKNSGFPIDFNLDYMRGGGFNLHKNSLACPHIKTAVTESSLMTFMTP